MTRFQTVLFDLDGTLIDHFAAIHRTHTQVRAHFGLAPPTLEQVRRAVGGGLENAIERLFGPEQAALVPQAIPLYRALWPNNLFYQVTLLPGARELLTALHARGVRCAVFTNKHGDSARELMAHLGVDSLLAGTFGASDTLWLKPQIEFAHHVLKAIDATLSTTCMVGDSPYDVEAGKTAGLKIFCVATGTHSAEELKEAGADAVYPNLQDLGRGEFGI